MEGQRTRRSLPRQRGYGAAFRNILNAFIQGIKTTRAGRLAPDQIEALVSIAETAIAGIGA